MTRKYKKENFDNEIKVNIISNVNKKNILEIFRTNNFFLIKKSKFLERILNNIKDNVIAIV